MTEPDREPDFQDDDGHLFYIAEKAMFYGPRNKDCMVELKTTSTNIWWRYPKDGGYKDHEWTMCEYFQPIYKDWLNDQVINEILLGDQHDRG